MMDRTFDASVAASKAGHKEAAARAAALNFKAVLLLVLIDDADAAPTTQAVAAFEALAGHAGNP
jgi:hypothetical protein